MITLFFTGLIANASIVQPICILVVLLFGIVIRNVAGIYHSYFRLLKLTMKLAKKSDIEKNKGKLEQGEDSRKFQIELAKDSIQKLVKYEEGVPYIHDSLFWFIVERCKPVRLEVAWVFLKILVATLAIVQAAKIIQDINEIEAFPDIAYTISTLIAVWVIPHLVNASLNPLEKQGDQRLKEKIKQNIQIFRDQPLEDHQKELSKQETYRKVWETIIELILLAVFVVFVLLSSSKLLDDEQRLVWQGIVQILVAPSVGIFLVVQSYMIACHASERDWEIQLAAVIMIIIQIIMEFILIVLTFTQNDLGLYCMVNVIMVWFALVILFRIVFFKIYPSFETENPSASSIEQFELYSTVTHTLYGSMDTSTSIPYIREQSF